MADGSKVKCRGSFPRWECAHLRQRPASWDRCQYGDAVSPRLENIEETAARWTATSATSFRPVNSAGKVETLFDLFSGRPFRIVGKLVALEVSSLTTKQEFSVGRKNGVARPGSSFQRAAGGM